MERRRARPGSTRCWIWSGSALEATERDVLERFVARYFSQVDPEDLAEGGSLADLHAGAFVARQFCAPARCGPRARARVQPVDRVSYGWQSTHTIVEIVNDDMPFLVDSVVMEVNHDGLTLHLVIDPIVGVERGAGHDARRHRRRQLQDAALRESFIHVEVDRIVEAEAWSHAS